MNKHISILFAASIYLLNISAGICPGQEKNNEQGSDGLVTVKGKIVQNDRKEFQIELSELGTKLTQQVQFPQPPLPSNWAQMTTQERTVWGKQFSETAAGKEFLANRKKLIEEAARFDLNTDDEGNFTVYDVAPGTYGLRGRAEKKLDGKLYVYEVFGQIAIKKEVEEVLLDPVMVSVTRILKIGDNVPTISVPTFDGKAKIENKLITGKHVLFNFWSLESPPSMEFHKELQEAYKEIKDKHSVQLVSVCVDSDAEKALAYVKEKQILGWHGHAADWQHPVLDAFGVRVLPSIYLTSNENKIIMTHYDFNGARLAKDANLVKIVSDAIEGGKTPTPVDGNSEGSTKKAEGSAEKTKAQTTRLTVLIRNSFEIEL